MTIVEKEGKKVIETAPLTKEQVDIEMAAHGGTVVEIRKVDGKWQVVTDSPYNRRITADTEMEITGPAAGHDRLKTSADASGTKVLGTINNCAGGVTPWGTYVSGEENFHGYFSGELPGRPPGSEEPRALRRAGGRLRVGELLRPLRRQQGAERAEPLWLDRRDRSHGRELRRRRSAPRSAASKHEGAESIVAKDGRVVFYLGDDERFDYVYKFVTSGTFNPDDRAANMSLLDEGTLYVAKFSEDGTVEWMPLVHGEGPLTAENGFESQADVLIGTRLAADLLGATKMDRPEDIQPNGVNGKVYVMLTNNTRRKAEQIDAANPRAENAFGHIIEIAEADGDFTATSGTWEILLKCGDPSVAEVGATFSTDTTANGWFGMPDNCADRRRRPPLGFDRRPEPQGHRPHRRRLGGRHRRRRARHLEALLPGAGWSRVVRPADSRPTWRPCS